MTHPSRSEVEAMAARADDAGRLAALALGFGDAMEKALENGNHHDRCAWPSGTCRCWQSILRAALEGWRK